MIDKLKGRFSFLSLHESLKCTVPAIAVWRVLGGKDHKYHQHRRELDVSYCLLWPYRM